MSDVRIGISGWRYAPWRGDFYPKGLVQRRELEFASREVNSIEINGSFYGLQTPERYSKWAAQTPDGFVFSVKAPRFITHVRRLVDIDEPLANFFASGPQIALAERLTDLIGAPDGWPVKVFFTNSGAEANEAAFKIARRTVAKYREQLNILPARFRRRVA